MKIDNVLAQEAIKGELPRVKMNVDPAKVLLKKAPGKEKLQDVLKVDNLGDTRDVSDLDDRSIELDADKVKEMAEAFNNFMLAFDQQFHFSVHEDTNKVWVRITDAETHEVLRDIPGEETLELAAKIRDFVGLLVDKRA